MRGGAEHRGPARERAPLSLLADGARLLLASAWTCALLGTCAAAPASGLQANHLPEERRWESATWVDELNFAAANALVSGLVTGVFTAFDDERTFADGFLSGAMGGAAVYAGKRVSVEGFAGAGLLGRQVAGTGISVIRNARSGRGALDELVFPLGPLRVHWDRAGGGVALKPDLTTTYWLTYGILEPRLDLDVGRSLSSGAPVFFTRDAVFRSPKAGVHVGGIVVVDSAAPAFLNVLGHERVHVIQRDHHFGLWAEPLEQWAVGWLGPTVRPLADRVRIGWAPDAIAYTFDLLFEREANPTEVEADFLQARSWASTSRAP